MRRSKLIKFSLNYKVKKIILILLKFLMLENLMSMLLEDN